MNVYKESDEADIHMTDKGVKEDILMQVKNRRRRKTPRCTLGGCYFFTGHATKNNFSAVTGYFMKYLVFIYIFHSSGKK